MQCRLLAKPNLISGTKIYLHLDLRRWAAGNGDSIHGQLWPIGGQASPVLPSQGHIGGRPDLAILIPSLSPAYVWASSVQSNQCKKPCRAPSSQISKPSLVICRRTNCSISVWQHRDATAAYPASLSGALDPALEPAGMFVGHGAKSWQFACCTGQFGKCPRKGQLFVLAPAISSCIAAKVLLSLLQSYQ